MFPDKECRETCANYPGKSTCLMCINRNNFKSLIGTVDVVKNEWEEVLTKLGKEK